MGLTIKKYPMCFATHRVIDATLDLGKANPLDPEQVLAVHATVGATQASMLRNHRPRSALEAKFSLEFAVTACLVAGKVGLAELTDEFVRQPRVQSLFERVRIQTVDTVCPHEPTLALSDRVCIETRAGTMLDSGEVRETRGSLAMPLSLRELRDKFMDCAAGAPHVDAQRLFDRLCALDSLEDAMLIGQPAART